MEKAKLSSLWGRRRCSSTSTRCCSRSCRSCCQSENAATVASGICSSWGRSYGRKCQATTDTEGAAGGSIQGCVTGRRPLWNDTWRKDCSWSSSCSCSCNLGNRRRTRQNRQFLCFGDGGKSWHVWRSSTTSCKSCSWPNLDQDTTPMTTIQRKNMKE